MPDLLPELREGDPYPGASYFNTIRRLIYRCLRINVEDGSGLTVSQGSDGTLIGGSSGGLAIVWAISGPSGIAARIASTPPPTGTVYLEGTSTALTAANRHYEAVPAWRLCECTYSAGTLTVLVWGCTDVPEADRPTLS